VPAFANLDADRGPDSRRRFAASLRLTAQLKNRTPPSRVRAGSAQTWPLRGARPHSSVAYWRPQRTSLQNLRQDRPSVKAGTPESPKVTIAMPVVPRSPSDRLRGGPAGLPLAPVGTHSFAIFPRRALVRRPPSSGLPRWSPTPGNAESERDGKIRQTRRVSPQRLTPDLRLPPGATDGSRGAPGTSRRRPRTISISLR